MLPATQWHGYNWRWYDGQRYWHGWWYNRRWYNRWRYNRWWYWHGWWYWGYEIAGDRGFQSSVSSSYVHVQQWHCSDGSPMHLQQRRILLELQQRFLPCDYYAGHRFVQTMRNRVLSTVADVNRHFVHEMDRVFGW